MPDPIPVRTGTDPEDVPITGEPKGRYVDVAVQDEPEGTPV